MYRIPSVTSWHPKCIAIIIFYFPAKGKKSSMSAMFTAVLLKKIYVSDDMAFM